MFLLSASLLSKLPRFRLAYLLENGAEKLDNLIRAHREASCIFYTTVVLVLDKTTTLSSFTEAEIALTESSPS
jgi:hypothetical protein